MSSSQVDALIARQQWLARLQPEPWSPGPDPKVGGCWVCFPRGASGPGRAGDPAWVAAVVTRAARTLTRVVRHDVADAPYVPGLLALRCRRPLAEAVRSLVARPDVVLLDATGHDHPRRAGLAIDLGEEVDVPTIGVTHRPLAAAGSWPADETGATSPLRIGDETVAVWLRTRRGTRPLVVHPGWRTDLPTAVEVVRAGIGRRRTPEPLRRARQLAREARAGDTAD